MDLLMVKAFDGADRYVTAPCHGCIGANANGFICGEDDYSSDSSWSSFEELRPRRERRSPTTTTTKKKKKKKQASSAVPYDDENLNDSLSVTSVDVSYTFKIGEVSSLQEKEITIGSCTIASGLRQRG